MPDAHIRRRALRPAAILSALLALAVAAPASIATSGQPGAQPTPALERFHAPAEGTYSGGRITADELPALRAAGIAQVIDLTPDAETPAFDEATAVRAAGMAYANLPIAGPADLTPEAVAAFDHLLRNAEGPVLVHCASGNRVGALAALRAAQIDGQPEEEAIAEGRRWGLGSLEGAVRAQMARQRCVAIAQSEAALERCAAGG